MKLTEFPLKRLNDFAAQMDKELQDNPFMHSPFGMSHEGECISTWELSFRWIGLLKSAGGCNFFGKEEMVLIKVPAAGAGLHPLASDGLFGWTGKINEFVAEMAIWWAFEITSDEEAVEFMKKNKPAVVFTYSDSNGTGEITVKYNGEFWIIEG